MIYVNQTGAGQAIMNSSLHGNDNLRGREKAG